MSEYRGAIDMFVDRSRVFIDNNTHEYLVIHKTAGFNTIAELGAYFATTKEMTSSHFGIGLNGSIGQYVLLQDGAAANCCGANAKKYSSGNINLVSDSIEHIDPSQDNSTPCTEAQLKSSFELAKWNCRKYNRPSSKIIRHADIDPKNKSRCPGNYPMNLLRRYVDMPENSTLNEAVVQIWEDSQFILGGIHHVPVRDDPIFNAWRNELIAGKFRGIPMMPVKQIGVNFNGVNVYRMQFSASMAWEDMSTHEVIWSDIT